jgi:tetratricopeptide (TPR) repeat protein
MWLQQRLGSITIKDNLTKGSIVMFGRLRKQEIDRYSEIADNHGALGLKYKKAKMNDEAEAEFQKVLKFSSLASNDLLTDCGRCSMTERTNALVEKVVAVLSDDALKSEHDGAIASAMTILPESMKALAHCREVTDMPEFKRLLAATHGNYGYVCKYAGQYAEADEHFKSAVDALNKIAEKTPEDLLKLSEYQTRHEKAARSTYKSEHGPILTFFKFGLKGFPKDQPVASQEAAPASAPAPAPAPK